MQTGRLVTGNRLIPIVNYTERDDQLRKWSCVLWRSLVVGLGIAVADSRGHIDHAALLGFEAWASKQVVKLEESYQLVEQSIS